MSDEQKRRRLLEILLERSFHVGQFTLASGRTSDYYIDCRTSTLHPEGALLIAELFLEQLDPQQFDSVGGLTLGADPIAGSMILKSQLDGRPLRGFIVRKEQKEHGRGRRIEGCLELGDRVAIIEDVVTTGGSAMMAVDAAREAGAQVKQVLAVVDREEGGGKFLLEKGLPLFCLFTASELKKAKKK